MSLISLLHKNNRKTLFTTPSHGQRFFIFNKFRQFYKYDISETETHDPVKALLQAQERAKKIYKIKNTYFLTNGSTSGIIASVLACTQKGDKVLVWRNAHPCHLNAVKLAGCEPVFYDLPIDKEWGIPAKTEVEYVAKQLGGYAAKLGQTPSPDGEGWNGVILSDNCENSQGEQPDTVLSPYRPIALSPDKNNIKAIIVTSPTYEGIVSDIRALKDVCAKNGAYLIVDEAHGALYPFSDKLPESAVNIADFTIQSLHKTAGGLNPTALLHVNCDLDAQNALNMINTTSPSYPLLASIEANINYLNSKKGRKKLDELIENIKALRAECPDIEFGGDDITKILIKKEGLSGFEMSEKLFDDFGIEDEKTNEVSTMLLTGIGTTKEKLERLKKALKRM